MVEMKEAKCMHCGKGIYGMTEKQVLYLKQAHELRCKYNLNHKLKAEVTEEENSSDPEEEE